MSWRRSSSFSKEYGIRNACRKRILNEVIRPLRKVKEWKVLVVDKLGMTVISACCRTEEVLKENIAIIETLEEKREPLPQFSAIYFVSPTAQTLKILDADFQAAVPLYFNVHLFFLAKLPEELFQHLCLAQYADRIKTLKEINILYLPCESQVFSLDMTDFFSLFFNSFEEFNTFYCETVADKLMTVFSTIGEIPVIRYRRGFIKNLILAEAIQKKINILKRTMNPSDIQANHENRCQMLIIDRGFDCISPFLHEFTFQAMAFDLFEIKNNIYSYSMEKKKEEKEVLKEEEENEEEGESKLIETDKNKSKVAGKREDLDAEKNEQRKEEEKQIAEEMKKQEEDASNLQEISLSEEDPLWCSFRHEHIANVVRSIQTMTLEDPIPPDKDGFKKLADLGKDVKKHFNVQKKVAHYAFKHLANECMKLFCSGLSKLAEIEQNLALETDSDGNVISNALPEVLMLLKNMEYTKEQKIRILFLYFFYEKGLPYKRFRDLLYQSGLSNEDVVVFNNIAHLGIDVFKRHTDYFPNENKVFEPPSYKMSRWTPMIKMIMQKCIAGTLSEEKYPFLEKPHHVLRRSRTGYWCADKKGDVFKLIIFIAGGATYSEMRVAYEVMAQYGGWEVIIGSDCLLTPKLFLEKLNNLPNLPRKTNT